jgi:hypothetical protein
MFWFKVLDNIGENKGGDGMLDIIKGPPIASTFLLEKKL